MIATSARAIAVFVPVALFPGTTGRIYRQFSLTIAFSIALSAFNALTLSPALSALILKPRPERKAKPFRPLRSGTRRRAPRVRARAPLPLRENSGMPRGLRGALVLTAWVYGKVPRAFLPDEDQGYVIISVQSPEGASLAYTESVVGQVEGVIAGADEVAATFSVVGFSFSGNAPARPPSSRP